MLPNAEQVWTTWQFPSCLETWHFWVNTEVWLLGVLGLCTVGTRVAVIWEGGKQKANERVSFMNQARSNVKHSTLEWLPKRRGYTSKTRVL